MENNTNLVQIETRVALVEREITQFSRIFEKFDTTIDKLTSVTNAIEKMLPLQALQISDNEKNYDKLNEDFSLKLKSVETRLDSIEKWKWILLGLAMGIGFMLGKITFPWSYLST